jgi:plasmid maintenance system antidote protein VapI
MTSTKLNNGDVPLIAEKMGVNQRTVRTIISGERGKRGTELQKNIKEAVELRLRQNKQLEEFCKSKAVRKVIPSNCK